MIDDIDLRVVTYTLLAVANVAVYVIAAMRRPTSSRIALALTAGTVSLAMMFLLFPATPLTFPRGFVLSLAMGAFLGAGLVILTSEDDE